MSNGIQALEFAYGHLLKTHRKVELIEQYCREKGLTRCDANSRSLKELCQLLGQPYLPLCMLPKPSQRRPLPLKQWTVPKEYQIYIVMSQPYTDLYRGWESSIDFQRNTLSRSYHDLEHLVEQSEKSPKWKWVCSYVQKHPDAQMVLIMSKAQYRAIQPLIQACPVQTAVWSNRGKAGKALDDFRQGHVRVLVVASDHPPWMDLPMATWVHFRPTPLANKRGAIEHYYLHSIKPVEKQHLGELDSWFEQSDEPPSLDLYRQWSADEDEQEEEEVDK